MFKKIFFSALCLGLLLNLSACRLPFTEKEITIPFLEKNPEQVMKAMTNVMSDMVDDFEFDGGLDIALKLPDIKKMIAEENKNITIETPSEFGLTTLSPLDSLSMFSMIPTEITLKEKISGLMDGDKNLNALTSMSIDFGNMEYKVDLEQINIGEDAYIKIKKLPAILDMFFGDSIIDKWIKSDKLFSDAELADMANKSEEEVKKIIDDRIAERKAKVEEISKDASETFKNLNFIKVDKRLADEKIDDNNCYHYQVSLNKEALGQLGDFVLKYVRKEMNESLQEFGADSEENETFKDLDEKMEKFLSALSGMISEDGGEIWVDKKYFYPRKVDFNVKLDLLKMFEDEEMIEKMKNQEFSVTVDTNIRMFNFNKNRKVEAPAEYTSIDEIIKQSPLYVDPKMKARDARRLSDVKIMMTALELYYNDMGRYPETLVVGEPIKSTSSVYLMSVPANEKPANDGLCPEDFEYEYTVLEDGGGYVIKYCLGDTAGGVPGYINYATEKSISNQEIGEINSDEDMFGDDSSLLIDISTSTAELIDTDNDGLYDFEEEFFGTDPENPDTDGDTYLDGVEVENGYNPLGEGTLEDFS